MIVHQVSRVIGEMKFLGIKNKYLFPIETEELNRCTRLCVYLSFACIITAIQDLSLGMVFGVLLNVLPICFNFYIIGKRNGWKEAKDIYIKIIVEDEIHRANTADPRNG